MTEDVDYARWMNNDLIMFSKEVNTTIDNEDSKVTCGTDTEDNNCIHFVYLFLFKGVFLALFNLRISA